MNIKSILVVGGGSSGWMTAATLQHMFSDDIEVSLVESDKSKIIGVGESTIQPFNRLLQSLDLADEDWMAECDATYKNSIRFTDFGKIGDQFDYPFGGLGSPDYKDPPDFQTWANLTAKYDLGINSFAELHNDNNFLAVYNRNTKNEDGKLKFDFNRSTAYHFNAEKFGQFLKKRHPKITHYVDHICGIKKDDDGSLKSVLGESGKSYSADLFIDCTGFQSLLLEKEMGSEFISFKPWLSNDSALATHIPYTNKEEQLTNVTNCTAIENGWVWNIPLWNNMGTGYCYSSDFVDDETAEKEFKKHLGVDDVDLHKIDIRHGRRKNAWVKNVVGVGLSYAFVEPLESTSLASTHLLISKLIEVLQRRKFNLTKFDIDGFNFGAKQEIDDARNFVSIHYCLSSRCDTPYWKYQTQERDFINLEDEIPSTNYKGMTFSSWYKKVLFQHSSEHIWDPGDQGVVYILAGMGHKPISEYYLNWVRQKHPEIDNHLENVYAQWRQYVESISKYIKTLPTSYEFLKEHIYGLTDEQ